MELIKIIDLFSGAGGFSLGFKKLGIEPKLAIDINHAATRTYSLNFPNTIVIEDDIREISGGEILKNVGNDIDVVIGGPPCEGYTAANPLRMQDPLDRLYLDQRGNLTLEFIRIVDEVKPKIFVMENVPAIIETQSLRDALINEFKKAGYGNIFFNILHAEDYGNPSKRSRVFISNVRISPIKNQKRITVYDAIHDLDNKLDVPNNEVSEPNEKKLLKISKIGYGKYLTMYRASKGRSIPLYIRLSPFDLAPTILGNSRFIHPFHDRFLTVREQARLMSYPDDHVFLGSKDEQYNQVGESVPVALSTAIAKEILGILNERTIFRPT
ncbi:DNA cytosine methyltransferase [Saccharolobus solfataricus]|uniref:DNA (cytosine-5-)-methyltransferase n=3 Tax=Saccharolobus solfataricus TaxID=2287 RepID=Q980M6_SACS2|nr:DNA cytosine methyltransferase [Saccharolobus solfataricus]AAK40604.1 DNA modification methylase, type II R/M system [Saccharolobus solfataricus P2]AKA73582.1 DNA cytosine methyltransferase [Saccharolobus solfataricus]AKA76280.1 DNA cytosine methyltransferase [Saccharolobus solfataricus]AKA78972.1 DNA cytosine methyltransferase [Saccharolobus solfataricus]AZF68050.1 DNA cytosine methyltransferase [Saccharolobus solfataricus]